MATKYVGRDPNKKKQVRKPPGSIPSFPFCLDCILERGKPRVVYCGSCVAARKRRDQRVRKISRALNN